MSEITINLKYKGTFLLLLLLAMVAPIAAQDAPPPPVVRLEVSPQVANVGDAVTIAVRLENVTNLYGLQVVCQVDPTVIIGASHLEGDAFTSANSFYVDQGMKPDGKWLVAATRLQPNPAFNGNGTAFTLQYTLQSASNANFVCTALGVDSHSAPLPLNLVNGTPVVTLAGEPTVVVPTEVIPTTEATEVVPTAEPTEIVPTSEVPAGANSTIQGVVVSQFAPDSAGIQLQLTANGSLIQQSETAADGSFSFADVPAGSYVLLVNAPEHLALVYNITVAGDGAPISLGSQTILTGDTDNNQTIDLTDAALISANFELAVPPAPQVADLNHDGQIDVRDLVLIGTNFGLTGPIQVQ